VKVFEIVVVMIMMWFNDDTINGTMMKYSNVCCTVDATEGENKCTVLYCSVLYCTVLYCSVLYCTVL
jgi:hypothetical protein